MYVRALGTHRRHCPATKREKQLLLEKEREERGEEIEEENDDSMNEEDDDNSKDAQPPPKKRARTASKKKREEEEDGADGNEKGRVMKRGKDEKKTRRRKKLKPLEFNERGVKEEKELLTRGRGVGQRVDRGGSSRSSRLKKPSLSQSQEESDEAMEDTSSRSSRKADSMLASGESIRIDNTLKEGDHITCPECRFFLCKFSTRENCRMTLLRHLKRCAARTNRPTKRSHVNVSDSPVSIVPSHRNVEGGTTEHNVTYQEHSSASSPRRHSVNVYTARVQG
tara:strand:- start:440 stop:1282 length:843 start_codon:yes stop_codon:yes gene_type:complete